MANLIYNRHRTDIVFFAVAMAFYLSLLYPSFQGGDTGEFLAASCEWGNVHPPGYPYQVILFKLWNGMTSFLVEAWNTIQGQGQGQLPSQHAGVAAAAYRAHFLSAVFTVFSAVLLRKTLSRITGRDTLSLLFSCLFLVLPPVTEYAIQIEVFPLFYFVLSLFYFLILPGGKHGMFLIGLVVSVLLLQHQTAVFFLLPALWVYRNEILTAVRNRTVIRFFGGMVVGALPIFALPILFNKSQNVYWGDLSDLGGIFHYLLRKDYGTLSLMPDESKTGAPYVVWLAKYALALIKITLGLVLVIGFDLIMKLYSVWKNGQRDRSKLSRKELKKELKRDLKSNRESSSLANAENHRMLMVFIGSGLLTFALVFHSFVTLPSNVPLQSAILSRMWNFSIYPLILFLGIRIAEVSRSSQVVERAFYVVISILILVQGAIRFVSHSSFYSHSKSAFETGSFAAISEAPQNSIFLVDDDHSYHAMLALQACGHVREDVLVLSPSKMVAPWQKIYVDRVNANGLSGADHKKRVEYPGSRFTRKSTDGFTMQNFLKANLDAGHEIVFYPNLRDDGTVNVAELGADFVPLGQLSEVLKLVSAEQESIRASAWVKHFDGRVSEMKSYLSKVDQEVARRDRLPFLVETTDVEWLRYQRDQSLTSTLRMYLYLTDVLRKYPTFRSIIDIPKVRSDFSTLIDFASSRSISIPQAFLSAYQMLQ